MTRPTALPGEKRKKNRLYYLLPGMNRSNRRRQKQILRWTLLVGILVSALIGFLIYWLNKPRIRYNW